MAEDQRFAHGLHFGDYTGVVFYGPPAHGRRGGRLAVSSRFLRPLFLAVLDRLQRGECERSPQLVVEWHALEGWAAGNAGRVPVTFEAAAELSSVLEQLTAEDVNPHCAGSTVEECLDCAQAIGQFLGGELAGGADLFIEDD